MNENDAFYNALIDVAAWDKENTLDRFMNSDSLFKKFLYTYRYYRRFVCEITELFSRAGFGECQAIFAYLERDSR